MSVLEQVGLIISIVLGLGAIGGVLIFIGKWLSETATMKENINGIGRKVNHIRGEMQGEIEKVETKIEKVEDKHNELGREVSEIHATVSSNHEMLQQLIRGN